MISIALKRDKSGRIVACTIAGHAEYDEHGYDIVCAAVSVLSCTALLGLTQIANQDGVYENESGRCTIQLRGILTAEGQTILETMVLGLQEIARQYADFVTFSDM